MADDMGDSTPDAPETADNLSADTGQQDDLAEAGRRALEAERASRKTAERQMKALQAELERTKQAQMTEAEKAVIEAEKRGAASARTELGREIARLRFDALAGRRNPEFDTAGVLEFFDLSRFLGEDGQPDEKALKAAVEKLIPAPNNVPGFDGGARKTAPAAPDMNRILREAIGRGQ